MVIVGRFDLRSKIGEDRLEWFSLVSILLRRLQTLVDSPFYELLKASSLV